MSSLPLAQNLIEIRRSLTTSSTAILYHSLRRNCSRMDGNSLLWSECPVQQLDYGRQKEAEKTRTVLSLVHLVPVNLSLQKRNHQCISGYR